MGELQIFMLVIPRPDRFAVAGDCTRYDVASYCFWRCGVVRYPSSLNPDTMMRRHAVPIYAM